MFYGWAIVFIVMIMAFGISGPRYSFGVFFKPIASEFALNRTATSSLNSAFMIFCAVFTISGGWALDKYGPKAVFFFLGLLTGLSLIITSQTNSLWQLYLSYSLLLAAGTGSIYPVLNATVSRWFDKKRGLALGIAGAGTRLGLICFAPFSAFLISHFGWRISYVVMGLVVMVLVLPISRLMRRGPGEVGALPDGVESTASLQEGIGGLKISRLGGLSLSQTLKTGNYWGFMPVWMLLGFANMFMYTHIVPYATDIGISAMEAATVISVIGIMGIPCGILTGRILDAIGVKKPLIVLLLFRMGAFIWLIWARELWAFYVFAVVFGISMGGIGICVAVLSVHLFGRRSIGIIMGTLDVAFAIGAAIGPFIGGLIYDASGSYLMALIVAATSNMITVFLIAFLKVGASQERVPSVI